MAHLRVTDDLGTRRVPLGPEPALLGRGEECAVVLAASGVSRVHARLQRRGDAFHVEDMGSRNGLRVNGEVVTSDRTLHDGDVIAVGEANLVLVTSAAVPPALASPPSASSLGPPEREASLLSVARRLLGADLDLDRLLALVLDVLVVETRARRGFVVLARDGDAAPRVARSVEGRDLDGPAAQLSRAVIREVLASGRPVLIRDAAEDPRFARGSSVHLLGLRSVLAVPMGGSPDPAIGAVYLDDPTRPNAFGTEEVGLATAIGSLVAAPVQNADSHRRQGEELARLRDELHDRRRFGAIVTTSPRMRSVVDLLRRAAPTDLPLILHGETGTGKELLARAVHEESARSVGPFVAVSLAGLSDHLLESELFGHARGAFTGAVEARQGLLREAQGGTLFLDDVGDMSTGVQAKLLRAVQERVVRPLGSDQQIELDVRFIAASTDDPLDLVRGGILREDLYYRLAGLVVEVPPLRHRREDIPALVERGLAVAGGGEVDPKALSLLVEHGWPGNVRELENVLREVRLRAGGAPISCALLAARLSRDVQIPPGLPQPLSLAEAKERLERDLVAAALERAAGNVAAAARELGMDRSQLHRLVRRLGLSPRPGTGDRRTPDHGGSTRAGSSPAAGEGLEARGPVE